MRQLRRISLVPFVAFAAQGVNAQTVPAPAPPLTAFDSAKVRALLRERLPCLGCHVVDSTGGRIAPELTRVATRRSAAYIQQKIDDPQRVTPGTMMPRVAMPPGMRQLVIRYLTGGPPVGEPIARVTPVAGAPSAASGAALYTRYCAACHGDGGRGDGPNARYLPVKPAMHADAAFMATRSDDRLYDAIAAGGYPLGRSSMMPAFGETLSRTEIRLLVRHLRTLCACAGPPWSVKR